MKTGLVPDVAVHSKDVEIVKALKAAKRKLGGGSDSVIAFRNDGGEIYRREVINGIHQEMYLADRLSQLGLVDETEQGARKLKGIWAVYGAGRDMSLEGVMAELRDIQARKKAP